MSRHEPNAKCVIECLRAQSRDAKALARKWDGTIGLDWHRIAKIHDKLAESLERWLRVAVDAS